MRTGQPHRTLHGHTGPVTCLQFDELHIVTGSLDKSIRVRFPPLCRVPRDGCSYIRLQIWDVRTGGIFETLKYDHAVTALQFDTRKIVAATGENGVKVRHFPMCTLPCVFSCWVPFWDITAPMGIACLPSVLLCSMSRNPTAAARC